MKKLFLIMLAVVMVSPVVLSAEPLMYVPSGSANDIVIIDLQSDTIIGHIEGLENAHGLSGSPNSDYLVAGSMMQGTTEKKPSSQQHEKTSEDQHEAHHGPDPEKKATSIQSFVSIVHLEHGHVMQRIAVHGLTHHTAVSPDGETAVAVHSDADSISVISLNSLQVVKTLQTGAWPNYAAFSPNGRWLYVSNARSGTISEINTKTWETEREINVGMEPEHFIVAPDSTNLFVANVGEGTAGIVNLATGVTTKSYKTGAEPHGIDISQDGQWLFVSSKTEGKLSRIDLKDDSIVKIDLQPAPYHLEYVDRVEKLYVSSRKHPKIWVIDPKTLMVISIIDIAEGVAHQMVVRNE